MEKDEKMEYFTCIVKFEGMTSPLIPAYEISDCIQKGLKSLLIFNKEQRKTQKHSVCFGTKKNITYETYSN